MVQTNLSSDFNNARWDIWKRRFLEEAARARSKVSEDAIYTLFLWRWRRQRTWSKYSSRNQHVYVLKRKETQLPMTYPGELCIQKFTYYRHGWERDLNSLKYYHLEIINKSTTAPALRINFQQWSSSKGLLSSLQVEPLWTFETMQWPEQVMSIVRGILP